MKSVTSGIYPVCLICGAAMHRLWAIPNIKVHRSAADVFDRALHGEGDPAPGMTMEQTRNGIEAIAAGQKQRQPRQPDVRRKSAPVTVYT